MKNLINIGYWIIAILPYIAFGVSYDKLIRFENKVELVAVIFISIMNFFTLILLENIYKKNNVKYNYRYIIMIVITIINILVLFFVRNLIFNISIPKIVSFICGITFLTFGIYMPKINYNKVVGIKTKWTLNDQHVWKETHKLSGITWVLGGTIAIINIFSNSLNMYLCLLGISFILVIFIPLIFSWLYWKRLNN